MSAIFPKRLEAMKENKKVQHNLDLSGKTIVNARLVNCRAEGGIEGVTPGSGGDSAETVYIDVHAYMIYEEEEPFTLESDYDGCSGTITIKGFTRDFKTLEEQIIPFEIPEGKSRISIPVELNLGDTVACVAKIPGKGASCQFVRKVVPHTSVDLEVFPAGLYEINSDGIHPLGGVFLFGEDHAGLAIVTNDFAFAWPAKQRSNWLTEPIRWSGSDQNIPIQGIYEAQQARTDYDGALNTAAAKAVINEQSAAFNVGAIVEDSKLKEFFLPSLGMLDYLRTNKAAINEFISSAESELDDEFSKIDDSMVECWWSSTIHSDPSYGWAISMEDGRYPSDDHRGFLNIVAAVCNFVKEL